MRPNTAVKGGVSAAWGAAVQARQARRQGWRAASLVQVIMQEQQPWWHTKSREASCVYFEGPELRMKLEACQYLQVAREGGGEAGEDGRLGRPADR